jgi:hypothetical protein
VPENYIQSIVERVAEIAKKTAESAGPVKIGTVLSVNPDGSVNVDTGDGGCARVAAVGNQVVTCGSTIVLGLEPQIGNTTDLCQVQFTINSSSKGCPIETRIDEVEVEPAMPMIFSDDDGNLYDENGDPTGDAGDPAARDISFDYESVINGDGFDCFAGPDTNYQFLQIGRTDTTPDNSGNQGIFQGGHTFGNTRLVQGIGVSTDRVFGLELLNTPDGGSGLTWRLVIRNSVTLAMIVESAGPSWLSDWFDSRPDSYPAFQDDYEYQNSLHVAADPVDGSFWLFAKAGVNGERAGLFNIDPTDLSLLQTINVDAVDGQFAKRMKRIS